MKDSQKAIEALRAELSDELGSRVLKSAAEEKALGKAIRKTVPRASHGLWAAFEGRPDPVELLKEQGARRFEELLPLRYFRMAESPFAFYRGAALIMASDLSQTPNTGITVQICGDAHISNFGLFASPERDLVFDINDFDETAPGPWEWDIKRLVASVNICAKNLGLTQEQADAAVRGCATAYRVIMNEFACANTIDVYYAHASTTAAALYAAQTDKLRDKMADQKLGKVIEKAYRKDSTKAVLKLTEVVDGNRRFKSEPPLLEPIRDLLNPDEETTLPEVTLEIIEKVLEVVVRDYCKTLAPDKQHLISQYKGCDIAHKVVGVGSVGLFDWVVLLQGNQPDDYLVLQIKEAGESVIERFIGSAGFENAGQRVVQGQKAIQATSDILLGWASLKNLEDISETPCDVYVRQLWDCKGSVDLSKLSAEDLLSLAQTCGGILAHAHARTGNRFQIAGYLGKSTVFDSAMVQFAEAYAQQNQADYECFMAAIDAGELPCSNLM